MGEQTFTEVVSLEYVSFAGMKFSFDTYDIGQKTGKIPKPPSSKSMGPDSFPVKYSFLCLFSSKHALVDDYRSPILNGFLLLLIKR